MEPSSSKIMSGNYFLAQDTVQSTLMGFVSPLVKAHAESRTQPVMVFCSAAKPDALMIMPRTVAIANLCFIGTDFYRSRRTFAIAGEPASPRPLLPLARFDSVVAGVT